MKHWLSDFLSQAWTLLGMFVAWVCLTGSARQIVTYAILIAIIIDATRQTLKKEEEK